MGQARLVSKMRIIARSTLREFWEKHPDAEEALQAWYDEVERAHWQSPVDIRAIYANASFLASNRVVFNIRGNHYRIVTHIHFNTQIVYIRFVSLPKQRMTKPTGRT